MSSINPTIDGLTLGFTPNLNLFSGQYPLFNYDPVEFNPVEESEYEKLNLDIPSLELFPNIGKNRDYYIKDFLKNAKRESGTGSDTGKEEYKQYNPILGRNIYNAQISDFEKKYIKDPEMLLKEKASLGRWAKTNDVVGIADLVLETTFGPKSYLTGNRSANSNMYHNLESLIKNILPIQAQAIINAKNALGSILDLAGVLPKNASNATNTFNSVLPLAFKTGNLNKVHYDTASMERQGANYGGVLDNLNKASEFSGNGVSWLDTLSGWKQSKNRFINNVNKLSAGVYKIDKKARERNDETGYSTAMTSIQTDYKNNNPRNNYISVGRVGTKLPSVINEVVVNDLPMYLKGGKTLPELIEIAKKKNPRFIQRMNEPVRDIILPDGSHAIHLMSYADNTVFPLIQEVNGNLKLFTDWREALKNARTNNNVLEFDTEEEAENFSKNYQEGFKDFFDKFLKGGKFNVIPDGALHARLHRMENAENLTKKGIPVVVENEQGEIEQQAEIEREEIIYRLEVTEQVEKLSHIYYDEKSSQQEKDTAALEAGKLIAFETLHNTKDNTNKLL